MIDLIFAFKFAHVLAVAVMFGGWLCIAMFMLFAHRSGNTSVVALTSRFVVRLEMMLMIAAMIVLPLSGFPLAATIGLSPSDEFWVVLSLIIFVVVVAAWLVNFGIEWRIRNLTRDAALEGMPLPEGYQRLFLVWSMAAIPILLGTIAIIAVMIWQPRLS